MKGKERKENRDKYRLCKSIFFSSFFYGVRVKNELHSKFDSNCFFFIFVFDSSSTNSPAFEHGHPLVMPKGASLGDQLADLKRLSRVRVSRDPDAGQSFQGASSLGRRIVHHGWLSKNEDRTGLYYA
jgi:hypothetical protein